MKLYLSSHGVPTPEALLNLFSKPAAEIRITIVPNAKDYKLPGERAQSLDELTVELERIGLDPDVMDLRDYEDGDQLNGALRDYDALWVAGGNTFVLRSEMRRSGFDKVIRELIEQGTVYCGESAGAIVAGLSLQGAEVADDPYDAEQLIWEGLGLTDRIIAPHADNPDFLEYMNHMKKLYNGDERVFYLKDNQALIVNDTEEKLATAS